MPDLPGKYDLTAHVDAFGQSFAAQTVVRVWSITTTPFVDGDVVGLGPISVSGTIEGPNLLQLPLPPVHLLPVPVVFVDNTPVYVNPAGQFGPVDVDFGQTGLDPIDGLELRVTHPQGATAIDRLTFIRGNPGVAPEDTNDAAVTAQFGSAAFEQIALAMEQLLEGEDLLEPIVGLSKSPAYTEQGPLGNNVFRMNVRVVDTSYDPDIELLIDAGSQVGSSGGLRGTLRLYDLRVDLDIWGNVLSVPFSRDGIIRSDPARFTVTTDIVVVLDQLEAPVDSKLVDLQVFSFTIVPAGFIGSAAQLQAGQNAIRNWLEDKLEDEIGQRLRNAFEASLNALTVEQSLTPYDTDLSLGIQSVDKLPGGLAIHLSSEAVTNTPGTGAPSVPFYRSTWSGPPSPIDLSGGFDTAMAFSDDFACQLLAASTEAGLLEKTIPSIAPGGSLGLTAGDLHFVMPLAGFGAFGANEPVILRLHATVPTVLIMTPTGAGHAEFVNRNVQLSFDIDTSYGPVTVLRTSLDESKPVLVSVVADGTLDVTALSPDQTVSVLQAFPGSPLAFVPSGVLGVASFLDQPDILLGNLVMPSLVALELIPGDVGVGGPALEHLITYGNLVQAP